MKYVGNFKDNLFHGYGTAYDSFGILYQGQWRNDLKHGYGTSYDTNGRIDSQGEWEDDILVE